MLASASFAAWFCVEVAAGEVSSGVALDNEEEKPDVSLWGFLTVTV